MDIDIVMSMNKTITITSKGQTTIPAVIRRKLGLATSGGVLDVRFNEAKGQLVITKQASIEELSSRISGYIKPGTQPVVDVDKYYQENRKVKA